MQEFNKNISSDEMLQYLLKSNNIDLDAVQKAIEMEKRSKRKSRKPYNSRLSGLSRQCG